MFLIIYVVQSNINLYQLHKTIKKSMIMEKRLHIKIFKKGFNYMGYVTVLYGVYKKVIKRLMYFSRALTRKLQLGPSGPNWESERSEHARSVPKCNWGGLGGTLSPPFPQKDSQGSGGQFPWKKVQTSEINIFQNCKISLN